MMILENMMRLRKLDQLTIRMEPYPGALIICSKVFGSKTTEIITLGGAKGEERQERVCICNCNLSEGWILEVLEESIGSAQLYNVMACNNRGKAYVKYENILASDFTLYEVGQQVLLTPYNTMAYLCCSTPTGVTGCNPLVSTLEMSDEDWRTTYLILPWCAFTLPRSLDSRRWRSG